MRTEKEMLKLLINTALADPRIRAAYLEGSRANPKAPRDLFQDYDVVYVVEDTRPFREDRDWIDRFGERLYMQYPEEGPFSESDVEASYGWLMQFKDGNRLDLHVATREHALAHLELYHMLVDKDGILPAESQTSDEIYHVKRPTQEEFSGACNEFWWCLNNVAKGLWRGELLYVMDMINYNIRPELKRLLEWQIGSEHDFSVSVGKNAKYMSHYLPPSTYARYLATYSPADTEAVWEAVFTMCELFGETAGILSGQMGFTCNEAEAAGSYSYLKMVHELPSDAVDMVLL